MELHRFELEHFLAAHEQTARYVLGTSGVATLPLDALPTLGPASFDYGHVPGEPAVVAAVAAARGVPGDEVLLTVGGTEALLLAAFALVRPGSRVLVEAPTYFPLAEVPRLLGARVERFARREAADWAVDVDALIARLGRDVSMVSLSNPNNPTGRATPARDLVRIAKACEEVDAWLLVDDIFRAVVEPALPVSRTLHPRIVTAESLTKCHGLSGLRAGWLLAPPEVRARAREAKALTSITNPPTEQRFAAAALAQEGALLARTRRMTRENHAAFRTFLEERPGLAWRAPDHPLLAAVRLPDGTDDVAFCEALVRDEGVLLVPGSHVDLPGFLRIGFGAEPPLFAEGLSRVARFLDARA